MKNILILLLACVVILGGYLWYKKQPNRSVATTNPPATEPIATSTTLTDPRSGFTITFGNADAHKATTASGTLVVGEPAVRIDLGSFFYKNTNLSEAAVILGASSTTVATTACLKPAPGEKATSSRILAGQTWNGFFGLDAAAGNRFDTTTYRAIRRGTCYEIQKFMHYGVYENYDPASTTEFKRDDIDEHLDSIVASFSFL